MVPFFCAPNSGIGDQHERTVHHAGTLRALLAACCVAPVVLRQLTLRIEALQRTGHQFATQLDAVADKQQRARLDLDRMTKAFQTRGQNVASLAFQLKRPPSVPRPVPQRTEA